MIVLIGFMGAGKTTVGRILADKTGLPFIDTDEEVERTSGKKIAEIFEGGEGLFRSLERDVVVRALDGPESVVAVGGGAISDPVTCAALGWHTVIHLDVGYVESMRRAGHDPGRPMLHLADPRALFAERLPIYERLAKHVIDTSGSTAEEVVRMILEMTSGPQLDGPARVHVHLGDRTYPVLIGSGIAADAGNVVPLPPGAQAFVITHPDLEEKSKSLVDSLGGAGLVTTILSIDEGETSKALGTAEGLLDDLARHGAHRSDLVVGFGGGVVCDLAGFVASTYHRGIPVLHVPTTLLAQVDAAIGGKTAVNLSQGKNLVGTIHQPIAVVCDVSLLRSLPDEELRSGLAEVIKYGLIADPGLLDEAQVSIEAIFAGDEETLVRVVRRAVSIKAAIVSEDEREEDRREVLNYGHTFGHAIEHVTGIRHGEAIALGMVAAAHLAVDLEMLEEDAIEAHRRPLNAVGLPTSAAFDVGSTMERLKRDKKGRGTPRFVLLDAIGSVRTRIGARDDQIEAALRKVAG